MPEAITLDVLRRELAATQDAIEKKIDTRFDNFEVHFDDIMTAIRATLDEVSEDLGAERRRELAELRQRFDRLAVLTGHPELATV